MNKYTTLKILTRLIKLGPNSIDTNSRFSRKVHYKLLNALSKSIKSKILGNQAIVIS